MKVMTLYKGNAVLHKRNDVVSTLMWHCINVMTLNRRLCVDVNVALYKRHDVKSSLMRRCINVMM